MRQPQAFRKGLGNQGRLIVSAFSLTLAVEGHRHDDIGRVSVTLTSNYVRKPLRKPRTQRLDLLELQQENRAYQRSLIDREAASAIKCISFVLAGETEPRPPFFQLQSKERATTNFADGWGNPFERIETFRTDRRAPRIREQLAAKAAISGKNYADQRVARRRKPRAQTFLKPRLFAWVFLNGVDSAG